MLVLFTHANHIYSDPKQCEKMQPYPPLQTLIAAAAVRKAGFDVSFVDVTFDREFENAIERQRPDLVVVCEDNFNYLTKMCLAHNRSLALQIAAVARGLGIPSVINSSDATDHAALYLNGGFDRVIAGEVEATLVEMCRNWPEPVRGAMCPGDDFVSRSQIRSLDDEIPSPAWDLLDIRLYREAWMDAHGYFSLNLVTSRGCPYRCNWCAKPLYGSTYRSLSPGRAAAELAEVQNRFDPSQIWYADDIFGLSPKWTREFAAELNRLGVNVPFKMQSRCDLMTRDTVQHLRRAGCEEVWMGAESGSQRVLDAMEKGIRVEEIYKARQNLLNHGIRACFFLQFGYPGEDWADIEKTINMVRETRPDDVGISVSYPLPGTRFYEIVNAQMRGKSNWSDSGDLSMMFQGAYSTQLYRALSAALHLEVREGGAADRIAEAWDEVEQLRCVYC